MLNGSEELGRRNCGGWASYGTCADRDALRVSSIRRTTDNDVAVGNHADQPITVSDRERTQVQLTHQRGGFLYRIVRAGDLCAGGHCVANLHDFLAAVAPERQGLTDPGVW